VEAERFFRKELKHTQLADTYYNLSKAQFDQKNLAASLVSLDSFFVRVPKDVPSHNNYLLMCQAIGDTARLEQHKTMMRALGLVLPKGF
jgi:hypothetical protein